MKNAGHGGDLTLYAGPVHHEQRLDEISGGEVVLPDEPTKGLGPAATTGSVNGRTGHNGRLESGRPARNSKTTAPTFWHVLCLLLPQNLF